MSTQRYVAECLLDSERQVDPDEPILWQTLRREHIAPNASKEHWEAFVERFEDGFADDVSECARVMWQTQNHYWVWNEETKEGVDVPLEEGED